MEELIPFTPLSVPSPHVTGLYFGINNVAFHGLFDTGSDEVVIPDFVAREAKLDLTYKKTGVTHKNGDAFIKYHAPLTVLGFSAIHPITAATTTTSMVVGQFLPPLVPPQIYLPFYSIRFTAQGVQFLPKRIGSIPFKKYNDTRPVFDFSVRGGGGEEFQAFFDTGSDTSTLSPKTAREIRIERFPRGPDQKLLPNDIHKYASKKQYYVPITLENMFSFTTLTGVMMNENDNIISAEQALLQGLRMTLSEYSADFF